MASNDPFTTDAVSEFFDGMLTTVDFVLNAMFLTALISMAAAYWGYTLATWWAVTLGVAFALPKTIKATARINN